MNILVLNGSPRPTGETAGMIRTFRIEEDLGIFTNHDKGVMEKISEMVQRM